MPNIIKTRRISRANNVTALIPQLWAQESVALLTENMQIAGTINRDFEEVFARFGDTVNTRQPSTFSASRKNKSSNVTAEDAVLNNIPVVLNQHIYHSFLLDDSDLTLAMQDLIDVFIKPAAIALAKMIDQVCLSQVYQFTAHQVGEIGGLSNTNGNALLATTRGKLNGNLVPDDGRRYLALGHGADAKMMENAIFTQADQRGDVEGLMYGYLGTKQGMHTYMSQNTPALLAAATAAGRVNNAGGYVAGTTTLTVDTFDDDAASCLAGDWIRIGKYYYQVTAVNANPATSITIAPGLIEAVAHQAAIARYGRVQINEVNNYAAGHAEAIVFDNPTVAPQVGQLVSFHASTTKYAIVQTNGTTSMLLDRPLEAAVNNDQWARLGPTGGGFNFAYHRNCMTLALRPLAAPRGGVESAVTNWNNIPMRAVITYDGQAQKHRVTLDLLAGIKVLDAKLGAVVLS
jgi:hypothetical protein